MNKPKRRAELKAYHRQVLINATFETIAELGIAGTSVTNIINRAGLSRGMIHLHFDSKNHLLLEAARHMSKQYYANLDSFLQAAGDSPQEKLEAMISADLSEEILNRKTVNVWYAFRGEARSQNSFARFSDTRDDVLRGMFNEAYLQLAEGTEEPDVLARDATHGTLALLEGMWTDFLLHSEAFNRNSAKRIVFRFLSALFPRNFDQTGARPKIP
ncbi:MAG: TetR family transcriptional regulator C-terminal domain-containing protein [Hyphomicrobiales bacterium]